MIEIPVEDLEINNSIAIELLCSDIIKNLKEEMLKNSNFLEELKGE